MGPMDVNKGPINRETVGKDVQIKPVKDESQTVKDVKLATSKRLESEMNRDLTSALTPRQTTENLVPFRLPEAIYHPMDRPIFDPSLTEHAPLKKPDLETLSESKLQELQPASSSPLQESKIEVKSDHSLEGVKNVKSDLEKQKKKISNLSMIINFIRSRFSSKSKVDKQVEVRAFHQTGLNLIHSGARGEVVTAEMYEEAAEKLKNSKNKDPIHFTMMLKLYEKAADAFMAKGDIEAAFKVRASAANAVQFNQTNPLYNLTDGIKKSMSRQAIPDVGVHMESSSSKVLEGLAFRTRPTEDGKIKDVLNFQLSTYARYEFQDKLNQINTHFEAFQQSLPAHMRPVKITVKNDFHFQGKDEKGNFTADSSKGMTFPSEFIEIEFANGGKVMVGNDPTYKFIHESLHVEVPAHQSNGKGLKQMQEMMSILGLGPVIGKQHQDDDERLKLGLMLKVHLPQAFDWFENQPNFYEASPAYLKEKIIEFYPTMKEKFEMYDNHPELVNKIEIFPGKEVYTLGDISEEMEKSGVMGLMAGVGSFSAAISILNLGSLSSEERLGSGINLTAGASLQKDIQAGAKGCFLRLINEKVSETKIPERGYKHVNGELVVDERKAPMDEFQNQVDRQIYQFSGTVQFLYDKEVMNRGALCYYQDQFGVMNDQHENFGVYQGRDDPITFAKNLGIAVDKNSELRAGFYHDEEGFVRDEMTGEPLRDDYGGTNNEVVIPGGNIDPQFIKGLLVQDIKIKDALIVKLDENKMLKDAKYDQNGKIIDGILVFRKGGDRSPLEVPLHDFIHVGNQFKKDMWGAEPKESGISKKK